MIQVTCTNCRSGFSVPDVRAGRGSTCPQCGHTIQVPAAARDPSPPKPPASARETFEVKEIPLADEPPRARPSEPARQQLPPRNPSAPVKTATPVNKGTAPGELPRITDKPGDSGKGAPLEQAPATTPGGLIITSVGDAVVVSFHSPRILDPLQIEPMGEELYALVDKQACRKIVLDFSNVRFLSSQMLGVLILLKKKVAGINGRLFLCAVHSDLQKLFRLMNLERVLPIVPDRHTALGVLSLP